MLDYAEITPRINMLVYFVNKEYELLKKNQLSFGSLGINNIAGAVFRSVYRVG
jgi:hypothetical protein